jgi:lipopolysaccharide transport system permease protein
MKREFQSKYQNSLLGALWNVINPLAMIVVYTVIFAEIMRAKLPGVDSTYAYSIYLCAGVLTWGFFSEITSRSQNVFIENANILKKINFPRICLPITIVCNAFVNFLIVFGLFTLFLIISGNFPGVVYLALIPVYIITILLAVGIGVTLGVLNVFFRDVGHFFGIFMQFWFWLTPIVYPVTIIPERYKALININPMSGIMFSCQNILVKHIAPVWSDLLPAIYVAIFFNLIGLYLYRRHVGEMVDEL